MENFRLLSCSLGHCQQGVNLVWREIINALSGKSLSTLNLTSASTSEKSSWMFRWVLAACNMPLYSYGPETPIAGIFGAGADVLGGWPAGNWSNQQGRPFSQNYKGLPSSARFSHVSPEAFAWSTSHMPSSGSCIKTFVRPLETTENTSEHSEHESSIGRWTWKMHEHVGPCESEAVLGIWRRHHQKLLIPILLRTHSSIHQSCHPESILYQISDSIYGSVEIYCVFSKVDILTDLYITSLHSFA